ncbi:unnamed protein product [Thelazia callipaeda]|uniref:C2H2-type domain-containing protein n=1 Tax=Thelazia callipaeda TaxID=103827 RepID=A0A0N5DBE1_THECL|nr:unnamed protein product [Thelazia callipaeda]
MGEDFFVRNGVMMRMIDSDHEQSMSTKRYHFDVDESKIYQNVEDYGSNVNESASRVANEVESYPCRYCPDRIFLTSDGLERHTEMEHIDKIPEVMQEISRIYNEWRRRERVKAIVKKRREALKKTRMLTEILRTSRDLRSDALEVIIDSDNAGTLNCCICGLTSKNNLEMMIKHVQAHRKNDDLKRRLLKDHGPDHIGLQYVARCTCNQCHWVFINEKNLTKHQESSHIRKRKFVCKWCGDVCLSLYELNSHKKNIHGLFYNRQGKLPFANRQKKTASNDDTFNVNTRLAQKYATLKDDIECDSQEFALVKYQSPCTTKCSECGLVTVKPSLLIRHMKRVHGKSSFSTVIEVKGKPNIKVDMNCGKVTWWCCDLSFDDRHRFIHHRKTCHESLAICSNSVNVRKCVPSKVPSSEIVGRSEVVHYVNTDKTSTDQIYIVTAEGNKQAPCNETAVRELRAVDAISETLQVASTTGEYVQLSQQVEDFDGLVSFYFIIDVMGVASVFILQKKWSTYFFQQFFLVDDLVVNEPFSRNGVMESAVDFMVQENDMLNSAHISSSKASSTHGKRYSSIETTDSDFCLVDVTGNVDEEMLQNDLPLPSESLMNMVTSSPDVDISNSTFSCNTMVGDSVNHSSEGGQSNILAGIKVAPVTTIPKTSQQLYDNMSCSSAVICHEVNGIEVTSVANSFSAFVLISNKADIDSRPIIDHMDSISLLNLGEKEALTSTTNTFTQSSLSQRSSSTVSCNNISFYVGHDMNSGTVE